MTGVVDKVGGGNAARGGIAAILLASLVVLFGVAQGANPDGPCSPTLRFSLRIAAVQPEICLISSKLVPQRTVVLALWNTDPETPVEVPSVEVFDFSALGKRQQTILYKREAMGETLEDFRFNGNRVKVALADFTGNGQVGWAMWLVPDTDYFLAITTFDPNKNTWSVATIPATDLEAKIEIAQGKILVPVCDSQTGPAGKPSYDLYYDVYRPLNGKFEKSGKRILASSAPQSEREHCKQAGP